MINKNIIDIDRVLARYPISYDYQVMYDVEFIEIYFYNVPSNKQLDLTNKIFDLISQELPHLEYHAVPVATVSDRPSQALNDIATSKDAIKDLDVTYQSGNVSQSKERKKDIIHSLNTSGSYNQDYEFALAA